LSTAKRSLIDWLNHPEQPITKETVKTIGRDIEAARTNSPNYYDQDMNALKKEVRDLMKQFKEGKRAQKRQRKEAKRERRATRKALKKGRRAARREGGCKGRGQSNTFPAFMPGARHGPPPMPPRPAAPHAMPGGFPFNRSASVPFVKGPHCGRGPPGMAAMHGGWPFTQGMPFAPGNISVPDIPSHGFHFPVSLTSEQLHAQALEMEQAAQMKEEYAIELRTAATGQQIGEKEKLKKLDEATALEEEAEKYRLGADRLGAEALHLDSVLARELEEDGSGQSTGIIQN
jgi:hypothetical protein